MAGAGWLTEPTARTAANQLLLLDHLSLFGVWTKPH